MMIETERLRIRRFRDGDLVPLAAMFATPEVVRHLALAKMQAPAAAEFAAEFVHCSEGEFQHHGAGAMALVWAHDGRFAGYAGLRPLPDRCAGLELMYAIRPAYWRLGLATEAAGAVINWGFRELASLNEIIALCRADNFASIRVLDKLGLEAQGTCARYYGEELALYSRWRTSEAASTAA